MTTLSPSYADLLQRVELFSGLNRMALAQVAAQVDVVRIDDGEPVFTQGDPPGAFYILGGGSLGVFATLSDGHAEVRLNTLTPGDFFGEMALLTDEPRSATVRAESGGAEVLRLDRGRFLDLIRREPVVAHTIAATLTRRLRMNAQVILQGERAITSTVQQTLGRLEPESRERVLRAVLLDEPSPHVLERLFGEHAGSLAAQFAELGVDLAQPSGPVVKVLRDTATRDLGADSVREFSARAASELIDARLWSPALKLLFQLGPRDRSIAVLGQALRGPDPLPDDEAAVWLDRISDEEAAQDVDLALAKAAQYEERDEPANALALLQRALGAALQEHQGGRGSRLSAEIARITGATGGRSSAALKFGLELKAPARPAPGRVQRLLLFGTAIVFTTLAFATTVDLRAKFVLLLGAAIAMWVSDSLPRSTISLALVVSWILSGVATADQALAGFGSKDWVFVLALLGLAVAIARSGLLFRVGLLLIRHMPPGLAWQSGTLLLTGILLGPVLPMAMGRVALTTPLALGVAQALRLRANEPPAAVLGLAAWIGSGPMLFTFLNASPACLLAWALLPEATRRQFDWIGWFLAAAPLTLLIALGSMAAMFFVLRPRLSSALAREKIELQLAVLGSPSVRELAMIAILTLTITGWLFGSAIHLDAATVALLGLIAAFLSGNLDRLSWREVDWNYLLFMGVLLAMGRLMSSLGLDRLAGAAVGTWLIGLGVTPVLFVVLVGAISIAVFAALGEQGVLFLSLALIPVASAMHVNPWVVIIAILSTVLVWLMPATTPEYLMAYSVSEGALFTHAQARKVGIVYALIVLAALAVSTVYWRMIGLM